MSTDRNAETHAAPSPPTMDSDSSAWAARAERWQGPTFAASWISPPTPSRSFDDGHASNGGASNVAAPHREDDHA